MKCNKNKRKMFTTIPCKFIFYENKCYVNCNVVIFILVVNVISIT